MTAPPDGLKRILIIEDNKDCAESLAWLLDRHGYEVKTVRECSAAIRLIEDSAPDVVILDVDLPGMNGVTLAARIRNLPEMRKCILIGHSGYTEGFARTLDGVWTFDCFLMKPVPPERMLECLSRGLQ